MLDSSENSTIALQNAFMQKIKENENPVSSDSQNTSETSNGNNNTQVRLHLTLNVLKIN